MKNTFLTIAVLLLLATAAQAKKTPVEFYPGVEGYLPNPESYYQVSEKAFTNEYMEVEKCVYIDIYDEALHDTFTFTKLAPTDQDKIIDIGLIGDIRSVVYKGKDSAWIGSLFVGSSNLNVKMKNASIGEFGCICIKAAQFGNVESIFQDGDYEKGSVLKVTSLLGNREDNPRIYGCYKSITAGTFGNVDGTPISTPKTLVLKSQNGGTIYLNRNIKYKAKNVNVETAE